MCKSLNVCTYIIPSHPAPFFPLYSPFSLLEHALKMFHSRFSQLALHYELEAVRMPVYDAEYDITARKLHAERWEYEEMLKIMGEMKGRKGWRRRREERKENEKDEQREN